MRVRRQRQAAVQTRGDGRGVSFWQPKCFASLGVYRAHTTTFLRAKQAERQHTMSHMTQIRYSFAGCNSLVSPAQDACVHLGYPNPTNPPES